MSPEVNKLASLTLVWLLYFILHSILASLVVKHRFASRWPGLMPAYRLLFNAVAVVLISLPLGLAHAFRGPLLWQWQGAGLWFANGITLGAVLLFGWSLRYYDGGEFLGLRQWRNRVRTIEDQERFYISPLHRFVRHPWYFLVLLVIWTRSMDPAFLVTSVAITLYFVVGSRLEERKLLCYHGEAYRRYRERVPPLVPLPWRYLDKEGARELTALALRPGVRSLSG